MPQVVRVNLRLPSFRTKDPSSQEVRSVDNNEVRFLKEIEVAAIPKPGDVIEMSAGTHLTFPCAVKQVHWHESDNIFVVACKYGKPRITAAEYDIISADQSWTAKTLL
jgi:hypothetical protein